jgi:hypothetical protein
LFPTNISRARHSIFKGLIAPRFGVINFGNTAAAPKVISHPSPLILLRMVLETHIMSFINLFFVYGAAQNKKNILYFCTLLESTMMILLFVSNKDKEQVLMKLFSGD